MRPLYRLSIFLILDTKMASVISVFTTKGDVYGAITAALPNETVHFVDDPGK